MPEHGTEWVLERTLGSKRTRFWWRADELGNLVLRRITQKGKLKQKNHRMVKAEELQRLAEWLAENGWMPLESDPSKLRKGTAREGIGPFLHTGLGWPKAYAIFASHLATVLTRADVLTWNGKKREMQFRLASADLARVWGYFQRRREEQAAEHRARVQADPTAAPGPPQPPQQGIRRPRPRPGRPRPPQYDWAERMRARSRGLRARYEEFASGLHRAQRGQRREAAVREWLRRELPEGYGVSSGEIVAADGASSKQIDVLVYARTAPPLQETGATVVVTAETACAAIEVKPVLDGHHLPEAMANVQAAKALTGYATLPPPGGDQPQDNPAPFGGIIAFTAIDPTRLRDQMKELEGDLRPTRAVDAVCLLDRGLIYRYPAFTLFPWTHEDEATVRLPLAATAAGEDSLGLFFLLLYYDLMRKRRLPPDLGAYAWSFQKPEASWR